MTIPRPVKDRIIETITKTPEGCWLWQGVRTGDGYGRISIMRKYRLAHRVSWEQFVGPIPDGLQIDHLCRVRNCVNPAHLEPVSGRENTLRGDTLPAINARKTHCPQQHEYTPENTRISASGKRACRACDRDRMRRRYWASLSAATGDDLASPAPAPQGEEGQR